MKKIFFLVLAGSIAQACPKINDTFACVFEGPGYKVEADMAIKTEIVPGGQKMTVTVTVDGESSSDSVSLTPISDRTDEVGIRRVSYCNGDKIVTDSSYGKLKAQAVLAIQNGNLAVRGQSVNFYYDEDANGKVIPGSEEYVVEDSSFFCKKK
ncbi:MAG: hypothetical protein ACK5Y2_08770 [Bdellovibrionales bacterium]